MKLPSALLASRTGVVVGWILDVLLCSRVRVVAHAYILVIALGERGPALLQLL